MPPLFNGLIIGSMSAVLVILAIRAKAEFYRRTTVLELFALLVFASLLHMLFGFPIAIAPVAKGQNDSDLAAVAALYVFMLLGMLAQHLYARFEKPRDTRSKFDLGLFIAPLFASPIIFIPLMVSLENADLDLARLTTPRIMLFCVAFQNGFFWKQFFDHKRREVEREN